MKISILISIFTLSISNVFAQTNENVVEINVPIHSAIVYLYGAEVSHVKQVNLNPGLNKIVFTGLSTKLNSKSIQVNTTGEVSILAISDAVNYMANQKESAKVKELKDSVTLVTDNVIQLSNDRDAYTSEKNMLLKNESIGGNDKGVAVAELKLAADLFRSRIKEINTAISSIDKQSNVLNEILIKLNGQLMELNAKNTQPSAEISILLSSKTKTNSTIDLKYIVSDAGWAPSYDLLALDINQPIELKYRAKVFNNTGIDWNDIKIKLSTADPSQSASKPVLDKWSLDYSVANQNYYKSSNMGWDNNAPSSKSGEGYMQNALFENNILQKAEQKAIAKPIEFEEIQVSELSAEFDIKINYSIPSDSKPYIVDVTEYKLPATYQHFSVPKLDRDAFLLARITGWEDLDLVEGPANVYYSGTYVGQSYISTRSVDDTLDLSLGRDNKVLVTRSKIKEYNTKKFLGSTTKETFGYEMNIKNNRKTPIFIEVNDQLPISTQGDIIVESIETSKAEFDSKTGKLTWKYDLQPGEVKKIILSFSVKYPKNTNVNFQKTKMKARAKF
ncbi:MAG: DUF4139 domain-containing protein [Bacteroidetes bacterium]|nr:DUF4139 domain-containing protein [Bacteroidota bacterium]